MAEVSDKYGMIHQNLVDAGCDEELVEKCMECVKSGNQVLLLTMLKRHKAALLSSVHAGQKKIDCLDFLTYRIQKNQL